MPGLDQYDRDDDATWQARRRRSRRGGVAHVGANDTIALDACWCGQPNGHPWPDQDKGAPHPREEKTVTVDTNESQALNMRMLRKFPTDVARMMVKLCNDHGVEWRFAKDGNHVFLYPPMKIEGDANSTRPFKVGTHRPVDQSVRYLEKWVETYVQPWLLQQQAAALAEKHNDPAKARRAPVRAAAKPVASDPTPAPAPAPDPEPAPPAPTPDPTGTDPVPFSKERALADDEFATDEAPEGWVGCKGTRGEVLNWWKRPGKDEWMCKDCGEVYTRAAGRGGHQRLHSQATKDSLLRIRTKTHLLGIARDLGIELDDDKTSKRITRLESELEKVTKQRDDLQARYDLIREAMKA